MADKDFKTIEEQLGILRSHGLTINNGSQAKDSGTSSYNILK